MLLVSLLAVHYVSATEVVHESKEQSPDNSDICDPRIDRMYEEDLDVIWKNIVNQDKVLGNEPLDAADEVSGDDGLHTLINATTRAHAVNPIAMQNFQASSLSYNQEIGGSNVVMMTKIFHELFLHRRSDEYDSALKQQSRDGIIERLSHYTLETQSQEFFARAPNGTVIRGVNIIGVIPGKNRGKPGDSIVLVGAHYDTVPTSPGVDDNGSGVVALLEIARLLSPKMGHLNNTIMLVAFDLEEKGVLGSLAFVNNYLIPTELNGRGAKFQGAYILDGVLNYDPAARSQVLPLDILAGVPESALWLRRNGNAGNFVSVWSRRVHDWPLWHTFASAWEKNTFGANITDLPKIFMLDPPIPRNPLLLSHLRFRAFFRSDHASFWAHRNRHYSDSLSAVLLTDMGKLIRDVIKVVLIINFLSSRTLAWKAARMLSRIL